MVSSSSTTLQPRRRSRCSLHLKRSAGGQSSSLGVVQQRGVPGELAQVVAARVRAVVLLDGTATPEYKAALENAGARVFGPYRSMEEAVHQAACLAEPGGVVLLSPGCASFGLFRDEFHRGEAFRAAVRHLASRRGVER